MLNVRNRLNLRFHQNRLFEIGIRRHSPFFTLIFSLNNSNDHSQFGFILSKKLDKSAVVRNRLKRRLTEIIRLNLSLFPKNIEAIIIPKRPAITATSTELQSDLSRIINK
jgi:ribonuclease P protein component